MTETAAQPCKNFDLRRKLAAESLGTALLVATVIGSGVMATRLSTDVALQLLANGLATAAILVALITIFGPVSGAHFNPVVSAVFCARGEISRRDALAFSGAQILGGVLGAVAAHVMFDLSVFEVSTRIRTGPSQGFSEILATFGLVLTILGGRNAHRAAIPWLVGLYIAAAYWFTASTSFANPAVAIARAFSNTFAGIRPIDLPLFIGAQFFGAFGALAFANWLFAPAPELEESQS